MARFSALRWQQIVQIYNCTVMYPFCCLQLYRNGQRLLEKQRFQFPSSWLYIDNIEGEWGAFNDIMRRKDSAIQQQVANLQMKIVQEDRAVETRTVDLLTDWEKTKPVTVSLQCFQHLLQDLLLYFLPLC